MFPGGRAVLVHPKVGWPVTIYWGRSVREVATIRIDAGSGKQLEPQEQLPLSVYIAALGLQLGSKTVHLRGSRVELSVEPAEPRPGRGPKALRHYEKVNARYDELVGQKVKAPIRVIAQEYGVKEGTVKVWRWRARKYLKGEER